MNESELFAEGNGGEGLPEDLDVEPDGAVAQAIGREFDMNYF